VFALELQPGNDLSSHEFSFWNSKFSVNS